MKLNGSKLLFGGKQVEENHSIPSYYGCFQPTAIFVPLEELVNPKNLELISTEIFGPFQIVTSYKDSDKKLIVDLLNSFSHHLTAGVVSNDVHFLNYILKNTVNGVTYAGMRARTTGAP